MKRAVALLLSVLMALSLFPASALAEGDGSLPESPALNAETQTPEPTEAPTPAPVESPNEAPTSELPSVDALFLSLQGCDTVDSDGTGHVKVDISAEETWRFTAKAETNGALSYRWQKLDTESHADDPYVDLDTKEIPSANDKTLVIPADVSAIGVENYYRCVVSATLGEETKTAYCCFTVLAAKAESAAPQDSPLPAREEMDMSIAGTSAYATDFSEVVAAIAAGKTEIICSGGNFAIDADLRIPSNVQLTIRNNYTTITVNTGKTLTNDGTIKIHSSGTLYVEGTLKNAGQIECWNGSSLNVVGSYVKTGTKAKVIHNDSSTSGAVIIIGVATNLIDYVYDDTTGFGFYTGLDAASENYASKTINILENATIEGTDSATIPANTDVYMFADFTLESGARLTNNGKLYVLEGTTLYNHGEIENNGEILAFGTVSSDGSMTGKPYLYLSEITTDEALRAALESGTKDISLSGSFSLVSNLTIPDDVLLTIQGVTLTVPSGITLTNNGMLSVSTTGRLTVKSGSTFANNGYVIVSGGTLAAESGGVYSPGELAYLGLDVGKTSAITGIANARVDVFAYATTEAMMRTALNYSARGYRGIEINVIGNISLGSNMTLGSDVSMYIGMDNDGFKLTVPTGKTLLNGGYLAVRKGNTLQINAGGTLVNNTRVEAFGSLINNGTITGSGIISYGDESVTSWAALRSAVEAKRTNIYIYGDITIASNLTIGSGTTLMLEPGAGASLTIPSGVTLTLNGSIDQTGGDLTIETGGKLVVNNYYGVSGGTVSASGAGTIESNGWIDFGGDAQGTFSDECYVAGADAAFLFSDADGAEIGDMDLSFVTYWCAAADVDALEIALTQAVKYQDALITLTGDAQIAKDAKIAGNTSVYLAKDVTLTIPADKTLELAGTLEISDGAKLVIAAGGTLRILSGGTLNAIGSVENAGTIESEGEYAKQVTSDAQLRLAIEAGVSAVDITGSFSLASNFTLPQNMRMSIQGATLTIPLGKTLQIDGNLYLSGGMLSVSSGGKLINNGGIALRETSRLTVLSGGTYTQADAANLSFTYGKDTISGIPISKIDCFVEAKSESQLRTGLALNGYRSLYVGLLVNVSLTSNLTVPKGVTLSLEESASGTKLAIPSGKTLTNNGEIALQTGSILDVMPGGTLNNTATGSLSMLGGELVANGTVIYAADAQVLRLVRSEAELLAALAAKTTSIQILADVALTEDVSIPSTVALVFTDGKTLTVPSGITLSIGATHVWLFNGGIDVEENGTLTLANGGEIYIDGSGSLVISGTITFGGERASIIYQDTGDSTLSVTEKQADDYTTVHIYASDTASLTAAFDAYEDNDYRYCEVYLSSSVTLTENVEVPNAVQLWIDGGKTLTIPAGKKLTILEGGYLRVEESGKIVVLGTLDIKGGAMIALGSASGSGTVNFPEQDSYYTARVTTMAQFKSAIDSGKRPLLIWGGGFTISTSFTIPKDVHVWFDPDSTVTISAGVTLTNYGVFGTHGKLTNAGTLINHQHLKIEKYATFINNGTLNNKGTAEIAGAMVNNGTVLYAGGCRVRFMEGATKAGTKADGTWFSLDGTLATGIEVIGPSYLGLGEELAQTYAAQMLPAAAWPVDVVWSIEKGDEFAEIDAESGTLEGIKEGEVTIRATSTEDDEIYGELVVRVVDYAIQITGEDSMVAGKTLQLSAQFFPSNLTKSTIVWKMDPSDVAYASVSATGLVLAKMVTEPHTVTVHATAADSTADPAQKEITIYPVLSAIQILDESGKDVTNATLVLNSNEEESLQLDYALIPADAMRNATWTLGITDAAEIDVDEDGVVTVSSIKGKAKLVTLSVKANDGSGKSASVKIQIASLSGGISVSGAQDDTLYSGKKVQLVAEFTDPKPSNAAVKWTMSPEYETYATLSATGILTAKTVTQAVEVQVVATPADGGPASEPYCVTIKPLTGTILLKRGENTVTGTTQTVDIGHETSLTLNAISWPGGAENDVTFTSNNTAIATVDENGEITVFQTGLVTITATAKDGSGKNAIVRLNVVYLPQAIEAVSPTLSLRAGANAVYRVKDSGSSTGNTLPSNLVRWSMSSEDAVYASLSVGGVLNAYKINQEKTITLKAEVIGNEEIAFTTIPVTIYPAAQSITLYREDAPLKAPVVFDVSTMPSGGSEGVTLSAKLTPGDAMQGISWVSSNTNVARVVDGVVSPVWNAAAGAYNRGTATITARTQDGTNLAATAAVQVVSLVGSISMFTAPAVDDTLLTGSSVQLKATLGNDKASNTKVYYSITEGGDYATLSTSGVLTAKTVYQPQEVKLLARAADGSCEDSMSLTIAPKDEDPLVIQTDTGDTILNGTRVTYNISSGAVSELISANGFESGLPVSVKWTVSSSSIARVETSGGVTRLRSLSTGSVTVTAKDSKGRTASFTAEFYKPATSLTINPPKGMDASALMLASGKTMQLTGAIAPTSGVSTSGVNWFIATDDGGKTVYLKETELASISTGGLLTAKRGILEPAVVKVYGVTKNAPYLSESIEVTITPAATGIDLFFNDALVNNTTMSFDLSAKTLKLDTAIYPADANQMPVWTTSNKTIATVAADGTVTALKSGVVILTATADGKSVSIRLNILVRVSAMEITSKTGFAMRTGSTLQLGVAFTPTAPSDKRVTWKLAPEDAQFASISASGVISARAGTQQAQITVQATSVENNKVIATQKIDLYPATTRVLILDEEDNDVTNKTLVLALNDSTAMTLSAQNLPTLEGGALQSVIWKSSNTNVLKVSASGELTAVWNATSGYYNTGTVTITATAADGSAKSASVKVFVGYIVKELVFADGLTVQGGKTLTLKPAFDPLNVTNKALKWVIKASDTPYATISSTGVLTAKKLTYSREITVYCYSQDGSEVFAEVKVNITM